MASPPTAPSTIEPKRHGQYTLKVGKGLKSGSSNSSFSSVKFNHKPNLSNGSRSTRLAHSGDSEASLSIMDQEDGKPITYAYKGRRRTRKGSYVLVFDPSTQTCTLEPVDTSYTFNLTSAPWATSSEKLSRQYPQIKPDDNTAGENGELDEDPEGEADPDNPYDFRHYLNATSKGRSPTASPAMRATGITNIPSLSTTKPAVAAARSRPATTKIDPLRQAPRKEKSALAAGKAPPKPTPTVRLDRRASTRPDDPVEKKTLPKSVSKPTIKSTVYVHSSDEDDDAEILDNIATENGGLEIDWGNEAPKKSLARAFERAGSSHEGPISLHSAANSPMGRAVAPGQQQRKKKYEQDVIDFGTSDNYDDEETEEEESRPSTRKAPKDEDVQMRDIDEESEGDDDVESMALGSPAHQKPEANDEDDFDAEFEAEMMQAMLSGDDDDPAAREESESESEAE